MLYFCWDFCEFCLILCLYYFSYALLIVSIGYLIMPFLFSTCSAPEYVKSLQQGLGITNNHLLFYLWTLLFYLLNPHICVGSIGLMLILRFLNLVNGQVLLPKVSYHILLVWLWMDFWSSAGWTFGHHPYFASAD